MTPTDTYLLQLVDQARLTIEYTKLPDDRDGEYLCDEAKIFLRPGMHARLHRSVLAHELAHAAFGDRPTYFGPVHAKQERRAEQWASLRLIDVDAYRHAEDLHGGHLGAIAVELGVMRRTVVAYQEVLLRVGQHVYVQPREGAGQRARRERIA